MAFDFDQFSQLPELPFSDDLSFFDDNTVQAYTGTIQDVYHIDLGGSSGMSWPFEVQPIHPPLTTATSSANEDKSQTPQSISSRGEDGLACSCGKKFQSRKALKYVVLS